MKAAREQLIRDEIAKNYLGQLPIICLVVTGYYGLLTLMHVMVLPDDILWPIASTSGLVCLASLTLYGMIRRGLVSSQQSHMAFVPISLLVMTTVYVHIFYSSEQHQLTNAIMILYALSLVTLHPRIYMLLSIVCSSLYIIALITLPGPLAVHLGFMLLAVLPLSALGFHLRYRAHHRSIRLLLISQDKAKRLSRAGQKIKAQMLEVQKANEARDVFLANVTHELRTPLTGVMGMLDLMRETQPTREQAFMIDTANKSAGFLLNIVNDLLDFAKLEAGKLALKNEPMQPRAVTEDVVGTFEGTAKTKGLTLHSLIESDVPRWVMGDSGRISQILLNLLSNAVKFTDAGSVSITLLIDQSKNLVWRVDDTGSGIPQDKIEKLFERFEQVDSTSTRSKEGTGIGLSIARELVQLFNGKIWVESKEGEGSSFYVSLPLASCEAPAPTSSGSSYAVASKTTEGKSAKVLVAEDNEINQILIKRILEKMEIDYCIVSDGAQAVRSATAPDADFDVILMDVQMPVLDGVAATKQIRDVLGDRIPIIAITANTMDSDLKTYREIGMQGHVGKPIKIDEFRSVIEQYIHQTG